MYSIAIATYRAVLRVPYRKASTLLTIYIYTEDDGLVHSGRSRREKGKGSYQPREGEDREVSTDNDKGRGSGRTRERTIRTVVAVLGQCESRAVSSRLVNDQLRLRRRRIVLLRLRVFGRGACASATVTARWSS
jgi:hypothetical protein